jgi:hypothetical protein
MEGDVHWPVDEFGNYALGNLPKRLLSFII